VHIRIAGSGLLLLSTLGLAACSPAPIADAAPDSTLDARADTAADRSTDIASESQPDSAPDVVDMDVATDVLDDIAVDSPPDSLPDSAPDAIVEAGVPYAFADFIGCTTNADCPAGTGECVTMVSLANAGDAGASVVSVASIFPGRSRPGVCSRDCTSDPGACGSLLQPVGEDASARAYTCQVVHAAASPYPTPRPAFPFSVSAAQMAAGVPFAALCRPSFGADERGVQSFCQSCTSATCATGVCWSFSADAAVTGADTGQCLPSCGAGSSCPSGFTCRPSGAQSYCFPAVGTCGSCADRDGDGRGVGHCSSRAVDCDDNRAATFYGATDACGPEDRNCDGSINVADTPGCTSYYRDEDNDGYGTGSAQCLCEASGLIRALRGGDCADTDGERYPGSGFTRPAPVDMNCDGNVQHVWTTIAFCETLSCFATGLGTDGWNAFAGGDVACGVVGQWGGCLGMGRACAFSARTQQCF